MCCAADKGSTPPTESKNEVCRRAIDKLALPFICKQLASALLTCSAHSRRLPASIFIKQKSRNIEVRTVCAMSLLVNSKQKSFFTVSEPLNLCVLINKCWRLSELHGLFTRVINVFRTVKCVNAWFRARSRHAEFQCGRAPEPYHLTS